MAAKANERFADNIGGCFFLKKVAVLQSNYIPWKGYFDIIHDVDLFLFYDEVQYTKNDWRNRNKILTPRGPLWLTLPCGYNIKRKICEVEFNDAIPWQTNHYAALCRYYANAPYYYKYKDFLEYIYLEKKWDHLIDLNRYVICTIAKDFLGIKTKIESSDLYASHGTRSEKLLSVLESAGTKIYVSGPSAKHYLNEQVFRENGIQVIWKEYSTYPEYTQLYAPFEHSVSILDLLFNTGPDAPYFIWGYKECGLDVQSANRQRITWNMGAEEAAIRKPASMPFQMK